MTAQEYIQTKLNELKEPVGLATPENNDQLAEGIFKALTSKKFRKYSVKAEYSEHIKGAIAENIKNNQPINLTFLGGAYKLWRLDESPESDWAELFACMYYIRWVRSICEIYLPGVWFDFFLDDVIVPRINNTPQEDVVTYTTSRQMLIDFLKPYMPVNLSMTLTSAGDQFASREAYEQSLEANIKKLSEKLPGGLPKLSDAQLATTELNVKATSEQLSDPKWREKVELIHSAYMMSKGETGYTTKPGKTRVFTQPLPTGTCLSVGSTKDSIMKFWVGVGVLKSRDESFRQLVLSLSQLEKVQFDWEDVSIDGLDGKNFKKIRVIQ